MNERIKQLYHQCREVKRVETGDPTKIYTVDYDAEKFAKLIVRECMRVADSHGKGWAHLNGTAGNRIRQHFGVEE